MPVSRSAAVQRTVDAFEQFVDFNRAAGVSVEGRALAERQFAEGNAWRHADAYLATRVQRELVALLDRGGVIGGGSAGARIQGDYMPLRGSEPADRAVPEQDRRRGFGFVKNVIIDPHVLARNRQFDMIGLVNAHPDMLGIGIDENTAIVVTGGDFEVIGSSYALVYDNQHQVAPDASGPNGTPGGLF